MKRLFLYLFLCAFLPMWGQSVTRLPLSLQQAFDLGMQSRLDLKNQSLQTQVAQNELKKFDARNFPQISGSGDFRYNATLQTNFLPGYVYGPPGSPDRAVQFGLPYNTSFGLNLKQNIYDPFNHFDRKITKMNSETEKLKLEQGQTDVKLLIAQSYYTVLLNEQKMSLSKSSVHRNKVYFETAQQKFNNNNLIKSDLDRSSLDYQNALVSLQKDSANFALSKLDLVNQLGLVPGTEVELTDSLHLLKDEVVPKFESLDASSRVEVKQEQLNGRVTDLNVKKQNNGYLPSLQFYANYTYQQWSREFDPLNGKTWYPYNYLGLQINLPIFDGFLKNRTRSEFLLKKQISQNILEKLRRDIDFEIRSALVALQNTTAQLQYARNNFNQAKELVSIYKTRFEGGAVLYSEVLNTEYSFLNAQNNLMNAYYDYLLAKLKWQKAKGQL